MAYRTISVERCAGGFRCVGCGRYKRERFEFQTRSSSFKWIGCYCAECVKKLDVIYDCYLEVGWGYSRAICHDFETARRVDPDLAAGRRPGLVPVLEKI